MHTSVLIPVVTTISPLWSSKQMGMQGFTKSYFKQIRGIASPYALAKTLKRFPFVLTGEITVEGGEGVSTGVEFSKHFQIDPLKLRVSTTIFSTPKANFLFIFLAIKEIISETYTVSNITLFSAAQNCRKDRILMKTMKKGGHRHGSTSQHSPKKHP